MEEVLDQKRIKSMAAETEQDMEDEDLTLSLALHPFKKQKIETTPIDTMNSAQDQTVVGDMPENQSSEIELKNVTQQLLQECNEVLHQQQQNIDELMKVGSRPFDADHHQQQTPIRIINGVPCLFNQKERISHTDREEEEDDEKLPHGNRQQRRKSSGKSKTIPRPYEWATEYRAKLCSLDDLAIRGINTVTGPVQCKRCEHRTEISYNLREKFLEILDYFSRNFSGMHNRATEQWQSPTFPSCPVCLQPNCLRPVIARKKREIDWLFMFLGQTLGCCTLNQLKYFCKHTKNHRTGSKEHVLYSTYVSIFKQLDPSRRFLRFADDRSMS